ncbi:ketodeoxygluconokinase [Salmonella enterica subsp. enterica serovar Wilhelmsburg]|uniref:2-dehydro-3-deoxygluconokinase n=1 Tax=Salmonella enterica subsp. enterica serovar Wilhelmsburg TaxID=1960126 RepID=A0A659N4Q7_SALET|nr:sugar kinase [Salmonella enterica]ELX9019421.1 sugar kinase [Salmonella enterica]TGC49887.1 ketodeoxygluconokinase [Salmonella enterica subsp. enterica serovar Wilhelmsburg]TGC57659.1 ketodeoxygluconokinase [Salmonella enterica subsp. enterica serovar Wilhelmsburg]TGC66833.1 ketodeoxygluconokinase [Salmonella enterica subsp. enterica serovar Wilhelmsburg]TGC73530.1 ketodeoxygluconokinase [Salmonella enterica subsp. enterica serovar Wilhelmsburg]
MPKKIAVIGECMIELSQKGADVQRGFGGDTLNTSVYIARQVDSAALSVHYVTALGTDSFSQQMLEAWQHENVDTSLTQRMENRLPGLYYIETDDTGERTFYYWRNEAAAKFWLESEQSAAICKALATFDYLYLSGISLAILSPTSRDKLLSLLRECRANGGKVIFDNNYRPRLWTSREETQQVYQKMLECTDIAFLTLDDEDALWGQQPVEEVIARTHAAGVQEVVVKRGADSCLVSIQGEALIDVPAVKLPKEKVIDTTAAGDSFSAGYLAVRLTGGSATDAAKRGHLTASTVIQYRGAIIPHDAMPQ